MNQDLGSAGSGVSLRGSLPIHIHWSDRRLPTIDAPCILRLQVCPRFMRRARVVA